MNYSERRKEQSQRTEEAILQSALSLSRERGFDGASIRDICRRAGITTGAFYHHFKSKEDMLVRGFASLDAAMERSMAGHEGDPPLDRLWLLLSGYARFMEEEGPELVGRYYQHRLSTPSFASMDPARYTHRAMLECLREISAQGELLSGNSPEWVADFLFRHFRGMVIDWILRQGSYSLLPKLKQDYEFFQHVFRPASEAKKSLGNK